MRLGLGFGVDKMQVRNSVKLELQTDQTPISQNNFVFQLPVGKKIKVNWGNGDITTLNGAGTSNITATSNYTITGNYNITITGNLDDITTIDINQNNLSGDLSTWDLSNWVNLKHLYLFINNLSGDLSTWDLSKLTKLEGLFLAHNNFSGDLSTWDLSAMTSLISFYIYNNKFTNIFTLKNNTSWNNINILLQENRLIDNSKISTFFETLNSFAGTNGSVNVTNTNGGSMTYADLTVAGKAAHASLLANDWTITMNT